MIYDILLHNVCVKVTIFSVKSLSGTSGNRIDDRIYYSVIGTIWMVLQD